LLADEVVKRTGAQRHAVHATNADAAATAADAVTGTDVHHDTLRRTTAAAIAAALLQQQEEIYLIICYKKTESTEYKVYSLNFLKWNLTKE